MILNLVIAFIIISGRSEGMSQRLPIYAEHVASLYESGRTMDWIANHLGTSKRIIANRLIEAGVKSRSHRERFNTVIARSLVDYFSNFKGRESAYILGYTMADGSIAEQNGKCSGVHFACAIKDRALLDGIKRELNLHFEVKEVKNGTGVRLRLDCATVAEAFEANGVVRRKTYIDCDFPIMPERCLPHYIRGVFDGDGCVYYNQEAGNMSVQFLGSKKFISGLRDVLTERANVRENSVLSRPGHWSVAWQSADQIKRIHDFMYPSGDYMFLERKREKFQRIIKNELAT